MWGKRGVGEPKTPHERVWASHPTCTDVWGARKRGPLQISPASNRPVAALRIREGADRACRAVGWAWGLMPRRLSEEDVQVAGAWQCTRTTSAPLLRTSCNAGEVKTWYEAS